MSPGIIGRSSAMAALLSQVMETPELINACMVYQDGTKMALYEDGDVAACSGHLSLLRLRRALRRKGKRSTGDLGNTSSPEAGASGSSSLSTGSSTRSVEGTSGSAEEGVSEGGKHVSVVAEEPHADGSEGDAKQDEGVPLLEDLRFSHLAVDWAAAQGHLAVVRCLVQPMGVLIVRCSNFFYCSLLSAVRCTQNRVQKNRIVQRALPKKHDPTFLSSH